ncbi:TATA binding protein associated factor [Aphelenchoides avenae]|nr:TATA binding protein associated factor [Aphelenchus avenae]
MDPDSPVMWIRVDPEMLLVRRTQLRQPPQHWEYMLRNERDVVAQLQAVEMLQNHANQQTQATLIEAVQSDRLFYRVRTRAALALTEVMNRLPEGMVGGPIPLIAYFQSLYGSTSAPQIPRLNNFLVTSTSLQKYFLMLALPHAIGRMRTHGRQCPQEVISFIHNLVRYNDNSINRYSDDHYRASLITALSSTLVAAEHLGDNSRPESLSSEARAVLEEVTHALNMDVLQPSFGHVVACRCLEALYSLQRCNHIPPDTTIFWKFGRNKSVYAPLRLVALTCLVTMQHRTQNPTFEKTILELLDVVLTDNDPFIRYALALQLFLRPPFIAGNE